MSLKDTLKTLMIRDGNLSVSALAKATQLPQPTLHQLCMGQTTNPRKRTLGVLATYFSVSMEQLLGKELLPEKFNLHPTPVLSWEDLHEWPCGIPLEKKKEIFLETDKSQATFALKMKGSSMEPLFPNGCLLIFDANKPARDTDYVLLYLKKPNQFSFKKIYFDGNLSYVKSINPEFNELNMLQLCATDKVIATLLEARITF